MREHLDSFLKLEFPKAKKQILRFVISEHGRELIEQMLPLGSVSEIRTELSLVSETKELLVA
jgi:dsDNA-specific endonuclease/ATPase MutS2